MTKGYLSKICLEAVSLVNLSVKRLELISLVDSLVQIEEGMIVHLCPGEVGKVKLNECIDLCWGSK